MGERLTEDELRYLTEVAQAMAGTRSAMDEALYRIKAGGALPRLLAEVTELRAENARLEAMARDGGTMSAACRECGWEGETAEIARIQGPEDATEVCPSCGGIAWETEADRNERELLDRAARAEAVVEAARLWKLGRGTDPAGALVLAIEAYDATAREDGHG